ncbi:hypothetical protein [Roseibium limicola]|nr:hypothetical protein [Roseibium limicola]
MSVWSWIYTVRLERRFGAEISMAGLHDMVRSGTSRVPGPVMIG